MPLVRAIPEAPARAAPGRADAGLEGFAGAVLQGPAAVPQDRCPRRGCRPAGDAMTAPIELVRPERGPALCEPVLRSVPDWFGIESAMRAYIEATGTLPTWIAPDRPDVALGFLAVRRHFPHAAEVHCIAVRRD